MNDQLREEFEDQIKKEKDKLDSLNPGSKEKQIQADVVQKLVNSYTQSEAELSDWYDKQERRRIDEEKNKRLSDIEEEKTKLSPLKAAIEIGKVVVPAFVGVVTTLLCLRGSKEELDETLEYERTGRINSSGGRSHKRPSIWQKR